MYIFYDTETSGLSRDFDQIFQAAFVFVDEDFNMLSSLKLESRRLPWVVPAPGAMLITGFTAEALKQNPLSQSQMMKKIDDWARARHWPILFTGYNTLNYDEHVLASNLAQNLLNPRLTMTRKRKDEEPNGRLDVMRLVRAVQVYMPGVLKLEEKNFYGAPSLSLGAVARQNGIALGDAAHDAMADIKATIAIAKLIRTAAPAVFEQMKSLTSESAVVNFMHKNAAFAQTEPGNGPPRTAIVTAVTPNPGRPGEHMTFDLSFDPAPYMKKTVEELVKDLKELYAEQKYNKYKQPFRSVDAPANPLLMPLDMADPVRPANLSDADIAARAALIAANPDFKERLAKAAALVVPQRVRKYDEEKILQPLPRSVARQMRRWSRKFLQADAATRNEMIEAFDTRFILELEKAPGVARTRVFAERILYAENPEAMSEERRNRISADIAARILNPDPDVPYMTIPKARRELEAIEKERAEGNAKWAKVTDTQIRSLKLYYTAIAKEFEPFAPQFPSGQYAVKDGEPPAPPPFRPPTFNV